MVNVRAFSKYFLPLLAIPFTALVLSATTIAPPVITTDPKDSTVTEGARVSFSVVATGDSLRYRWHKNDVALSGGSSSSATYSITQASGNDSGATFKCVVSNSAGSDTSASAMLRVTLNAPTFQSQPVADTTYEGTSGYFRVRANGSRLTYQWQRNSVNCTDTNAVKSTYYTPPTILEDNGSSYKCIVSNSGGTITSDSAFLYVLKSPPVILTQPVNDTVALNSSAIFSISVYSKYPPTLFQWRSRSTTDTAYTDISGATDSIYTTPAVVDVDNNKRFLCVVTDSAGTRTSNYATLCILYDPPVINVNPVDANVKVSDTVTFAVSATGSALKFQWQRDTTNITGATDSIYRKVTLISDTLLRTYRCIVSNTGGADTSTSAQLIVKTPLKIISNPKSDTVNLAETATFTVSATSKYPPMSYQWITHLASETNYVNITGATDSTYTTPAVAEIDNGRRIRCIITDSAGSVTSDGATLVILFPTPVITEEPVGDTVNVGDTVSFKVKATGGGLSYQWQRNATNIMAGGRDTVYTKVAALADNGVIFRCIVRNTGGADTSTGALLVVNGITEILGNNVKIQKTQSLFTVGPNPATDMMTFKYLGKKSLAGSLMIYDAVGNLLYKKGNFRLIPDTRSFLQWNMNNQRGRRAGAGSYLAILLVKNTDGSVTAYGQNIGIKTQK